jgi:hypothetical protein
MPAAASDAFGGEGGSLQVKNPVRGAAARAPIMMKNESQNRNFNPFGAE